MFPITTTYQIPKLSGESTKRYWRRLWFISNQKPETITQIEQAIKWSIIDANITYDQVKYSDQVMDVVTKMSYSSR